MKKILFICAENAGRSQMSEAFFNTYKNGDWIAESAGTIPAKEINHIVIEALKEEGIEIANKTPVLFDPSGIDSYEKIISYGCLVKEFFSQEVQVKIEEWDIDDPKDKTVEEVRSIRDKIKEKVLELIKKLK
jgi:protein-tyrosine-phosphatase